MELLDSVSALISNLGFPIFCVCVMFYQLSRERDAHKEEADSLSQAINNNTVVMQKVLDKLEQK